MTNTYESDDQPETRFLKAQQAWDNMIGSAAVREKNWRLIAFAASVIAIVSIVGLIIVSTQKKIIPYVIEIHGDGEVKRVGKLSDDSYTLGLSQAVIKRELRQWITNIRTIAGDPIVVQNNWLEAYYFVSMKCKNQLDVYAQQVQPVSRAGEVIISVNVSSIISIQKDKTYQIEWEETHFGGEKGQFMGIKKFKGIFSLKFVRPKTEQQLQVNPFGMLIDEYNWQEITV